MSLVLYVVCKNQYMHFINFVLPVSILFGESRVRCILQRDDVEYHMRGLCCCCLFGLEGLPREILALFLLHRASNIQLAVQLAYAITYFFSSALFFSSGSFYTGLFSSDLYSYGLPSSATFSSVLPSADLMNFVHILGDLKWHLVVILRLDVFTLSIISSLVASKSLSALSL
jgi:hypothetical protein